MSKRKYHHNPLLKTERALLRGAGAAAQRDFLQNAATLGGGEFSRYFEGHLDKRASAGAPAVVEGDSLDLAAIRQPLSAADYTQGNIFASVDAWDDVDVETAAQAGFWAGAVMQLLEGGALENALPLLMTKDNLQNPQYARLHIQDALAESDSESNSTCQNLTQVFFARVTGLQSKGGQFGLLSDCPLARAWWQRRMAKDIARSTGLDAAQVLAFIGQDSTWRILLTNMTDTLTVIADANIRDGLIWMLMDLSDQKRAELFRYVGLENLCAAIGVMSAWRALGYFSPEQIKRIIADEIIARIMPNFNR